MVVRNGHHRPRTVVTAAGPVENQGPASERSAGGRGYRRGPKAVPTRSTAHGRAASTTSSPTGRASRSRCRRPVATAGDVTQLLPLLDKIPAAARSASRAGAVGGPLRRPAGGEPVLREDPGPRRAGRSHPSSGQFRGKVEKGSITELARQGLSRHRSSTKTPAQRRTAP
ncbi:predicted protein [Streptomyces viridosporus ATCC 14672]|uniref:Predicted protein n=1 Tax=Streptomyces viridosporus (strain ATCC 14672 / DSM 40746 / JCM 4963 / KCTC 9882 / NRRL B-12104 / FH 1290) TaxID=566461 RepID=D5ZVF1_STRV1|nr:predicted protein [Streptomyces viridosporus ATCC 14672]